MSSLEVFYARLFAVAKLVGYDLDVEVAALYKERLADVDYASLVAGLDKMAEEVRPGMPFPSIRAIREASTGQRTLSTDRDDDAEARLAATMIVGAQSKFGAVNGDGQTAREKIRRIEEYIGAVGWEIVRLRGGWNLMCQMLTVDNVRYMEPQLRELARGILERRRAGFPDALPPSASADRPNDGLKALSASQVEGLAVELLRKKEPGETVVSRLADLKADLGIARREVKP